MESSRKKADDKYNLTAKGKLRKARYAASPKGKLSAARREKRYRKSPKGRLQQMRADTKYSNKIRGTT